MKNLGRRAILAIAQLFLLHGTALAGEPVRGAPDTPAATEPDPVPPPVPGQPAPPNPEPATNQAPVAAEPPEAIPPYILKIGELSAKFDDLNPKGWNFQFPSVGDTVLRDVGGFRSALAKANIGISIWNIDALTHDMLSGGRGAQIYNGQKPTGAGIEHLWLTYNIPSVKLQVVAAGSFSWNTWHEGQGPNTVRISNLTVRQELFDGKVVWEAGYVGCQECRYYGFYTGGNVAGGLFGNNGNIPYQVGMAYTPYGVPTVNLKFNFPEDVYLRATAQRSFPAAGPLSERRANTYGLRPYADDSEDVTFISEIGKQRKAAPGAPSHWYRLTGWYNSGGRNDFRAPLTAPRMTQDDWAFSAAVDHQIWQKALPFDGVYAGATFQYAPPAANLYSQYYEVRLYSFGLIPERELDMFSIIASHTRFSGAGRRYLESIPANPENLQVGVPTNSSASTISGNYSMRLFPGTYASAGLAYAFNPAVSPKLDNALIYTLRLTQFL